MSELSDLSDDDLDKLEKGNVAGLSDHALEIASRYASQGDKTQQASREATRGIMELPKRAAQVNSVIAQGARGLAEAASMVPSEVANQPRQKFTTVLSPGEVPSPADVNKNIEKMGEGVMKTPGANALADYLSFEREKMVKPVQDWIEGLANVEPRFGEDFKEPTKKAMAARAIAETVENWTPWTPSSYAVFAAAGPLAGKVINEPIKAGIMAAADFAPRKVLAGLVDEYGFKITNTLKPENIAGADFTMAGSRVAKTISMEPNLRAGPMLDEAADRLKQGFQQRMGFAMPDSQVEAFKDYYAKNMVAHILKMPTPPLPGWMRQAKNVTPEAPLQIGMAGPATPSRPVTPKDLAPYGLVATPEAVQQGEKAVVQQTTEAMIAKGVPPEQAATAATAAMDKAATEMFGPYLQEVHNAPEKTQEGQAGGVKAEPNPLAGSGGGPAPEGLPIAPPLPGWEADRGTIPGDVFAWKGDYDNPTMALVEVDGGGQKPNTYAAFHKDIPVNNPLAKVQGLPDDQFLTPHEAARAAELEGAVEEKHPQTGKKPHEMTREEFQQSTPMAPEVSGPLHAEIVDKAIEKDLPIPPNVMEEHQNAPPATIPEPTPTEPPAQADILPYTPETLKGVEEVQRRRYDGIKDFEDLIERDVEGVAEEASRDLPGLRKQYEATYDELPPAEADKIRARIEDAPPGLTQNPWDQLRKSLDAMTDPEHSKKIMDAVRNEVEINPSTSLATLRNLNPSLQNAIIDSGVKPADLAGALTMPYSGATLPEEAANEAPTKPVGNGPEGLRKAPADQAKEVPGPQGGGGTPAPSEGTGTGNQRGPGEVAEGPGKQGPSAGGSTEDGGRTGLGERSPANRDVGENLRLSPDEDIEPKGKIARFQANLKAIRLLKQIEGEGRLATPEEQKVLVRYVGWGQLSNAFNDWSDEFGKQRVEELKELLTPEEHDAAQASTINAHYTAKEVIGAIYEALDKAGFSGGKIIEPSMGVGHFFGYLPEKMSDSRLLGIELDGLTARIAKQLYQKADVRQMDFGDAKLPNNYFDLAITNVPFGDTAPYDKDYVKGHYSLHDYFIVKSMDKVREGGMGVFITSRYSMDKKDAGWRRAVYEHSDLVLATRLPDTAFKGNADTSVVTDLLFFRKRLPGEKKGDAGWLEVDKKEVKGIPHSVNKYFIEKPEAIIGTLSTEGTMYRRDSLTVKFSGDLQSALKDSLSVIPEGLFKAAEKPTQSLDVGGKQRKGEHIVKDGKVFQRTETGLVEQAAPAEQVEAMLGVRDAFNAAIKAQIEEQGDKAIKGTLKELNALYDKFRKKYGPLNKKENASALEKDPDLPRLLALESFDKGSKSWLKTDFFKGPSLRAQKTIQKADTAKDSLGIVLNETGKVNISRMAELTSQTEEDVIRDLQTAGLIYKNPEGNWETAEQYLGGNVRSKLISAKAAAALEPEKYKANVDALEAVQPPDLAAHEITVNLGAHWVPPAVFQDFYGDITDTQGIKLTYLDTVGKWTSNLEPWVKRSLNSSVANSNTYGTRRISAFDILELAMDGKEPTIYDKLDDTRVLNVQETEAARDKLSQIKERFSQWIFENEDRQKLLTNLYNEQFNNYRVSKYDGSHLTLPGSNPDIVFRPYQKDAIWKALSSRENVLLAIEVGGGKTFTMAAVAMEARRLGLAKKVMITVQNATIGDFPKQFKKLYPAAKLLVLDSKSLDPKERKTTIARAATQDWDAIIIPHSMFGMIPMSVQARESFYKEQVDDIAAAIEAMKREAGQTRGIVKDLEKAKKRLEATLQKLGEEMKKDDAMTFEELGVDMLFVDESQDYKNLYFFSKMGRIAGLGSGKDTQRSFDMFMKTRHVTRMNSGRGVLFSTGTPVSNSMAEVYTLQRYLTYDKLKAEGMHHFDAWAAQFGQVVTSLELSHSGKGFTLRKRFAKFNNVAELMKRYLQFAHIIRLSDIPDVKRPEIEGGKTQIVRAKASQEQKDYVDELVRRVEKIKAGSPGQTSTGAEDNNLTVTTDGRKAAMDMRLVKPDAEDYPGSKVNMAVQSVFQIWKDTKESKGTQLVFSDYGVPNDAGRFNVYDDIRTKLIALGIPKEEVAFIHEGENDSKRDAILEGVKSGKIRVLLGSTDKLGIGVNVQDHGVALHDLDAPWRPDMVEQRHGRFIRVGNRNKTVKIFQYVTEETFDAYIFQTLEAKARSFEPIVRGDHDIRTLDDSSSAALTYEEIKAIASGSPLVIDKIKNDREIQRLTNLEGAYKKQVYSSQAELSLIPAQIQGIEKRVAEYNLDLAQVKEHQKDKFSMTIDGKVLTEPEEAGKEIMRLAMAQKDTSVAAEIGEFKGFPLIVENGFVIAKGKATRYSSFVSGSPTGTVQAIENKLETGKIEGAIKEQQEQIARFQKREKELAVAVKVPFKYIEDLKKAEIKAKDLDHKLGLDKEQTGGLAEPKDEPDDDGGDDEGGMAARGPSGPPGPAQPPTAAEAADRAIAEGIPLPAHLKPEAFPGEHVGLIKDGKIGAGKERASKIKNVTDAVENYHGKGLAANEIFLSNYPVEIGEWEKMKLRPIEMPELLEFVRQKGVQFQITKRLRTSAGLFKNIGHGLIKLRPDIFKNPKEAAAVMAHEIGHWVDWFGGPDAPETMKRGNLLGHLYALRHHLKGTFGDAIVNNKDARAELTGVSEYWRPYDKTTASADFIAYRNSANELYADMVSVLFNSPGTLQHMAPKTWKAFFDATDKRPEIRLALEDIWGRMQGEDADVKANLAKIRRERLVEMMDTKAEAAFREKMIEKHDRDFNFWDRMAQALQNQYYPILKRQKAARLAGSPIPEEMDLRFITQEMSMANSDQFMVVWDTAKKVVEPIQELGIPVSALGIMSYYDRVLGDRSELANPMGFNPSAAKDGYQDLLNLYGYDGMVAMRTALSKFHEIAFNLTVQAVDVGLYSQEMMTTTLIPNKESYVAFQTLEHIDDFVSPGIMKQVGTFSDINNPILSTTMKMVALTKAINAQRLKKVYVEWMLQAFPGEIHALKPINPGDKLHQFRAKTPGYGVVELSEDGKKVAYEVPYLEAESLSKGVSENDFLPIHIIRMIHRGVWQKLWLDWNPGWAMYLNPIKDVKGAIKSLPGVSLRQFLSMRNDPESVASAERFAKGELDPLTEEMVRAKAIPAPISNEMQYNTMAEFITAVKNEIIRRVGGGNRDALGALESGEEYDQYMHLLGKYGLLQRQNQGSRWPVVGKIVQLADWLSYIGRKQEALTKIAGYRMRKEVMGDDGKHLAYEVRTYIGTPPFMVHGKYTSWTNALWPYSNITLQGYVRDYEQASGGEGNERKSDWWFKTAKLDLSGKVMMALAASGAGGKILKDFYDRVSEYDKTNYLIIPLGWKMGGEFGWKAVYMRIPHDESGRLLSGTTWKMLMAATGRPGGLTGLFDFTAGQFPTISPTVDIPMQWAQMLQGKNPYDSFRGRYIIPDNQFKAGMYERTKRMIGWTIDETGMLQVASYDPANNTTTEWLVRLAPVLNKMIKISDFGMTEKIKGMVAEVDAEEAKYRLTRSDTAKAFLVEKFRLESMKKADTLDSAGKMRLASFNTFYSGVFQNVDRAIKNDMGRGDQKSVEHNRKRLDVMLKSVMRR